MGYTGQKKRDYAKKWIAQRRAEFFHEKSCISCGSTNRLELDHIDPKLKISHAIWSWSKERREAELAKCQILCYDCHKIKTAQDMQYATEHGRQLYNTKNCRCEICVTDHALACKEWRIRTNYSRTSSLKDKREALNFLL